MTDHRPGAPGGPALLAIDLGTTEVKCGLVALDGRLLALARAGYPTEDRGIPGAAEQDAAAWWSAIRVTVAELLALVGPGTEVVGICPVGHGPTLVACDADGRPVRRAVTWLDRRSAPEAAELTELTGLAGWELSILPAALRLQRTDPVGAAATRWYLNSWEALALRLSGVAAETRLPGQRRPDPRTLGPTGLDAAKLAPAAGAGTRLGSLLPEPALDLGLPAGIPVVAGMVDAYASFFGAGLLEAGDAVDTGGTAGGFAVYADRPVECPGAFVAPAPIPDRWVLGGAMSATGKALDWLVNDALGGDLTVDELLAEAAAVPPGADGLLFLPYLAGERAPIDDPEARGAFVGLTLGHGRAHLARAVVEGASLALRHVADPIIRAGAPVRELRVSGSAAGRREWNQVKADVTGFTVALPANAETAVAGAAIAAAVGIGAAIDLATATRAMVAIGPRYEPRAANRERYDRLFETYAGLYPALAPSLHALGEIEALGRPTNRERRG